MAYNLACWCIQMAYTQHSWMLMDIVVGLSVRPSVCLFVYGIFRWLCICKGGGVVIIGRWLLPSHVDTGDICCHYWQHILVFNGTLGNKFQWNSSRNSNIYIQEKAFENVFCKMAAILSRPQCAECTLHWRHNRRDCVSNHQPYDCLLNRLFRHRSKKTSKLCVTGLCAGNSPGPVNSPHKWPVTRKMFPFDDIIMTITGSHYIKSLVNDNRAVRRELNIWEYPWKLFHLTYRDRLTHIYMSVNQTIIGLYRGLSLDRRQVIF